MWSKVDTYIKKHKLLNASNLYLVALSGGADSVALLLLLKEHGFNVHAAHCNFHLRGAESDGDEAFCVELCQGLGVALHRVHFDTREYAEVHQVSIEMAARELRYRWFEQLREDIGAAGICVAHHRDDSVETVILNLVRGTGLRGLTGIQPRNGSILRPLLCVSRAEIEDFLAKKEKKYVTVLRELNPAVVENIQRMTEHVSEAQAVLDAVISQYKNGNSLELSELDKYCSSEYIAFEWLKNYGFNGSQVRQILDAECGGMVHSEQGYDALKDRGRLIVEPALPPFKPMRIPEEGTYVLKSSTTESGRETTGNETFRVRKCAVYISKKPHIATLDAAKVRFPLTIRRAGEGDWMQPYGMKGKKLLSDLMTDLKMTVFEKRRQLVVVDSQGIVVWAVGLRIADFVAVSDATTAVIEVVFSEQ